MRFRLVRSRVFWFGVPGLVFLLWGWWVSMGHWSEAGFVGARPWAIGQAGGEVFAHRHSGGPAWGGFASHQKVSEEEVRRWKEMMVGWRESDPAYRFVLIPYAWVVVAYGAVWAGFAYWRSRRYRALPAVG